MGGAERVMLNLAAGLAGQDMDVDLVLASAVGELLARVPQTVRVVDLGARRVLTSLPSLVHYIRSARPCAMVSAMNHANLVAILARWSARVPLRLVVAEHNTMSRSTQHAASLRDRAMPLLARWFYPRADAIVAVSQGVADDLARTTGLSGDSIHVVHNPVVTPELAAQAAAPIEHPWFAPGEPPVILAVGRLTRQKDYPTLIEALAEVRRKKPARLLILGEGEERARIEAMARTMSLAGAVMLPGIDPNPYRYMAHAAVFAMSSAWEGLPTVLIEALAAGATVVSTDCPSGPREILEGGRWGMLVPVGDAKALAAALVAAMEAPGRRNAAEAVRRFTVAESVRRYREVMVR